MEQDYLMKVLESCKRNRNKCDLNNFMARIDGGSVFVKIDSDYAYYKDSFHIIIDKGFRTTHFLDLAKTYELLKGLGIDENTIEI